MAKLFTATNQRGNLSITQDHPGYAYIGKYAVDASYAGFKTVTFPCVGMPLVFLSLPYNIADTNPTADYVYGDAKAGVVLAGLVNNQNNTWTATVLVTVPQYVSLDNIYIRVFGRVSDNWPNGSGRQPNLLIKTDAGLPVFDAGVRMLKLAGNTYNVELTLNSDVPNDGEPNNKYDTSVALPFDLNNKSISAMPRSTISFPYHYGDYTDWETGEVMTQWQVCHWDTVYAASGNSLLLKRAVTNQTRNDTTGFVVVMGTGLPGYSRLSVIDNTKYP